MDWIFLGDKGPLADVLEWMRQVGPRSYSCPKVDYPNNTEDRYIITPIVVDCGFLRFKVDMRFKVDIHYLSIHPSILSVCLCLCLSTLYIFN